MNRLLTKLWKEEQGQDLTEYALLVTLIALASVAAMNGLAAAICTVFSNASTQLS
jgi:Flp pilus assembly pilin Flp